MSKLEVQDTDGVLLLSCGHYVEQTLDILFTHGQRGNKNLVTGYIEEGVEIVCTVCAEIAQAIAECRKHCVGAIKDYEKYNYPHGELGELCQAIEELKK